MNKAVSAWVVAILWSGLALASGNPPLRNPDAAAQLSQLEAAAAADPDNLRPANAYRMAVIAANQYDRSIRFFAKLVADHPKSSNAYLNCAFAYVDKIPVAGTVTQLILGNNALAMFSKSIDLEPSWLGYFARGKFYLYWPTFFERTKPGVADLETALKIQKADTKHSYHVYTYVYLGDGYWKLGNLAKAREVWSQGLAEFPANAQLKALLAHQGDALKTLINNDLDYTKRVDTNLQELWAPS